MIGVLLRLQALTLRGRIVRSLRLMRQPKYLIGTIAGVLWMLTWVGRPLLRTGTEFRTVGLDLVPDEMRPAVHLAVALVVSFALVLPWLWPFSRPGMRFRESELTFLLQAPLTRRQVIGYGILKSALGTLFSALLLAFLLGGDSPGRLRLLVGMLPLFVFWALHSKWRAMVWLGERERPSAAWKRGLLLALGAAFLLALAIPVLRIVPQLVTVGERSLQFQGDPAQAVPASLRALLLPARLLTAPLFAEGLGTALVLALPVLLLAVVQLELVLRNRAPFEESALEWAKASDARQAAGRKGVRRRGSLTRRWQTFPLASHGRPEVAVLWKNLMRVSRLPLTRGVGAASALLVLLGLVAASLPLHPAIHVTVVVWGLVTACAAPLFGGVSFSNDLRTELLHLELVRTWPVAPARFVLAQVASPALLGTLVAFAGLALALVGYLGIVVAASRGASIDASVVPNEGTLGASRLGFVLLALAGAAPLLAAAAFAASAMQNVATLFIPAWMIKTPDSSRGIAAIGRNMIVGAAMFLGYFLAFLPSALLVGLAMLAQHFAGIPWTAWAFPLWGVLGALPLFGMTTALVLFAGRLWAELDPSQELLEIGR